MKRSIGIKPALIPTPVLLVGTYDADGNPNAMTVAWAGVCSSNPVSIAFSVQKSRHSYQALIQNRECTLNIPSEAIVRQADFFGVRSGSDLNKFEATGLTPVKAGLVNAPVIAECPLVLECRISQVIEIGVHTQFIAEVVDVQVDESLIAQNGDVDIGKVAPFLYNPLSRAYHKVGEHLMDAFTTATAFPKKK
ncbi:MAG: flavin reductase family protein [Methanospirillum sp.]|uniref:flavin reductase family protein n=1 Tax=Methanospirillum sp. TaxID=45200 RepID=UPI00236BF14F|nr:flavin reductase family protein [Methanospirillum sp.]MDD1729691.1 flavin reductase family protein [Methanospirillum sp.]